MAFYISGPKLLFETTEISTHPNSTQRESNYIYLYTTKFGTSIKIRLNRKFETMRVNCMIKAKLYKNVHWMVLYKLYVFCSDMKFKMAATAGLSLTLDPMGEMFENASSLKPLEQLKPNCPGMIIGRSSTNFMFFMPIGNPRWPPPQYID